MSIVEKGANGMLRPLKQMGIDLPIAAGGALKVKQANDALSAAQQKVNADLAAGAGAAAVGSAAHNKYEADVAKVTAAHTKLSAAQDTGKQILDALSQRLGGQAAAAADTFQGKLNAVKAQGENLAATIGLRLIPILEKVMTVVTGVITWFEKHKAVAIALGVVIGGMLTIAIGVWVVGIVAAQVALISAIVTAIIPATAALITFAMTVIAGTWPILLIIAAIVLVGVAVYEVINHWGAIANFFSKVWGDIRKIFFDAWHAVVGFVVGLWNDVTGWFAKLWTELVKWVTRIWTDIKTAFVNGITDVVNFVGGLQAKILGILAGAITWLLNIGSDIISGLWNGIKAGWALLGNIGNTIWGWLKTAVVGAVTWLVQAGSDIVTGLINGISSAWGQVWSFIQGKLSGLMKSVLGFFGISSPSTVFHDIGKNLMVGLANGINAHGGLAQTALTGLSANLTGTLAVNSGIVPLPSVSSSGGGQQVMVATTVMVDGTALLKTLQPAGIQLQRTLSQPYFGSVR
jgi:ABC-type Zn2+ transport system substrate-binding protein/surface adhesin